MKKTFIFGIIVLAVALLASQIVQAQETTYLSNVGEPSTGSLAVGSDSWLADGFYTGNNGSGYILNSVQLGMADASGDPNGFTVMIFSSSIGGVDVYPVSSLDTLNGSTDPTTVGIYTYTPAANLTLLPDTGYYIVLTAATAVANGAYDWSYSNYSYDPSGGWQAPLAGGAVDNYQSSNGTRWNYLLSDGVSQYAINATAVPEPSELALGALGALLLGIRRWRKSSR